MYILQNNIEIIAGAKKYCIYNLNTQKIYSLDAQDVANIYQILNGLSEQEGVTNNNVEYLVSEGIITQPDSLIPKIPQGHHLFSMEFAWVEITQNCNLICRHCYEESSRGNCRPEMTVEDFKFVVKYLQDIGVDRIQLVGGEPLVHTHIEELINYIAGKFSFIEIFTNGTLLSKKLLDVVEKNGASLALSVYAESATLHDYVTNTRGSYDLTMKHIRDAVDRGIDVRIASIEMKDIPKFQFSLAEVPQKTDLPRLTGRADISLYSRDMLKRKLITMNTFKYPVSPEVFYQNKSLHNCFGERLYIDCNLDIYPCAMERRICYGNLKNTLFSDIMGNKLPTMTKDKIQGCKDCEFRYACYDCRCDANGAPIDAKPWYCTYDPYNGVWKDVDAFIDNLLGKMKRT